MEAKGVKYIDVQTRTGSLEFKGYRSANSERIGTLRREEVVLGS